MKKALCIFLSSVMIFAAAFSAAAAGVKLGDVTGDNKINSSDALLVLMSKVGLRTLNSTQKKAADVDGNGQINSTDALLILSYSVNLIKKFPVEGGTTEKTTVKTTEKTTKPTEKPTEKTTVSTTAKTGGNMEYNVPDMGHDTF